MCDKKTDSGLGSEISRQPRGVESDAGRTDASRTYVWISLQTRIEAQVIEESPVGLALLLLSQETPEVGFQVRVETSQGRRTAKILSVNKTPESNAARVELSWVD